MQPSRAIARSGAESVRTRTKGILDTYLLFGERVECTRRVDAAAAPEVSIAVRCTVYRGGRRRNERSGAHAQGTKLRRSSGSCPHVGLSMAPPDVMFTKCAIARQRRRTMSYRCARQLASRLSKVNAE